MQDGGEGVVMSVVASGSATVVSGSAAVVSGSAVLTVERMRYPWVSDYPPLDKPNEPGTLQIAYHLQLMQVGRGGGGGGGGTQGQGL